MLIIYLALTTTYHVATVGENFRQRRTQVFLYCLVELVTLCVVSACVHEVHECLWEQETENVVCRGTLVWVSLCYLQISVEIISCNSVLTPAWKYRANSVF